MGETIDVHWYCPCGLTRQVMDQGMAERVSPSFSCQGCHNLVGPVYESEELIRHEVEGGGGC